MIAAIALVALLGWLTFRTIRHFFFQLPPGPTGLPIVGYLPFLSSQPYVQFSEMVDKYGDIMSLRVGSFRVIVVSSLDLIREMFKESVFSGRTDMHIAASRQHAKLGLLLSDGRRWQDLRRFSLRNLRDLGFGKWSQENLIINEIDQLAKTILNELGRPTTLTDRLNIYVVNTLWSILTGETIDTEDSECQQLIYNMNRLIAGASATDPIFLLPMLNHFGKYKKKSKDFAANARNVMSLAKRLVRQHNENRNSDRSDFMHIFMDEVQKNEDDPESTFNQKGAEDTLAMILVDLFIAGNETTSTALLWFFLLMAAHPQIQRRVQQEIDSVVDGSGPLLEHRRRLPYTEAVLMETLRFGSVLPMTLRHRVTEDTYFRGYLFPEGSILFGNLYKVMRDPQHWAKPHQFYPDHFLNSDGTVKQADAAIPFGSGKRICLGESLARLEFFLFAARLIHQFNFEIPDGQTVDLAGNNGAIRGPKPYRVIITQRIQ
uniref:CYP3682A1 n=1 Tax=Diaphanosoma celebensis TaxID=2184134 RepID=A0A896SZA9_9CRUS|nr:CYP3682A1 [Diaphanosoma celebensis]QST15079.1 CYP370C10 protein [Diaphanosoma celebensis]